jgi:hypothetical protein
MLLASITTRDSECSESCLPHLSHLPKTRTLVRDSAVMVVSSGGNEPLDKGRDHICVTMFLSWPTHAEPSLPPQHKNPIQQRSIPIDDVLWRYDLLGPTTPLCLEFGPDQVEPYIAERNRTIANTGPNSLNSISQWNVIPSRIKYA